MFQRRRPKVPTLPAGSRCPECGRIVGSESQQRHSISVRATTLSLGRFGIASPEATKRTEKEWATYRAENRLDLYGRRITSICRTPRQRLDMRTRNPDE